MTQSNLDRLPTHLLIFIFIHILQIDASITLKKYAENLLSKSASVGDIDASLDKYKLAVESLLTLLNHSKAASSVEALKSEKFVILRRVIDRWLTRAEKLKAVAELKRFNFSVTSIESCEKDAQVPVEEKTQKIIQNFCRLQ